MPAAVKHVLGDPDLLLVLFARVAVVGIHDDGRIGKVSFCVQILHVPQFLVMIVGMAPAVPVHIAPQYHVGEGIARGIDFPASVEEGMGALGRKNGIHHDGQVSGRGILHAHRDPDPAGYQSVLLVLHRSGSDGHIGKQV